MRKKWCIRLAVIVSVFAAFVLSAAPALAILDWCGGDPQLNIEDHNLDLKVSILTETTRYDKLIIGNMLFTVTVPYGTDAEVIFCEKKMKVKIIESCWLRPNADGSIPVKVTLTTYARERCPLKLEILLDGAPVTTLEGTTNSLLSYRLNIP